jgi:CBS domain-containing protein
LLGFTFLVGTHPQLQAFRWAGGNFLNKLMWVNVGLLTFNVIPAFPMDGGRVLRALLATRLDYTRATLYAARVGQAMAFLFGLIGLFTDPFLVFIALFVWMGAEQESAVVQVHSSLGGTPVGQAMLTHFQTVQADDALARAVERVLEGWQQDFPVVFGDHVLGMLTRENLTRAIAQGLIDTPVRASMDREFVRADSHDMLEKVLAAMRSARCRSVPVLHDGKLVGLLTLDHVGELLTIHSALRQAQNSARSSPRG